MEQLTLFAEDTLASLSPSPGSEEARRMTVTSGRKCFDLFGSCGPLGSLERMLLGMSLWASTMYFLTWKVKVTPAGRSLFQLRASAPRTKGKGSSSWPTPTASDGTTGAIIGKNDKYGVSRNGRFYKVDQEGNRRNGDVGLARTVYLTETKAWPTPHANCHTGAGTHGEGGANLQTAVKMWPTPRANKIDGYSSTGLSQTLGQAVRMWSTPAAQDGKNATLPPSQRKRDTIPGAVIRTGENGQLNPAWVETLMGFPIGWTEPDGPPLSGNHSTTGSRPGWPWSEKPGAAAQSPRQCSGAATGISDFAGDTG